MRTNSKNRLWPRSILIVAFFMALAPGALAWQTPRVPNAGFEVLDPKSGFAEDWIRGFGMGTRASAEIDTTVVHGGLRALRISDATLTEAYKYALVNTPKIAVLPETTYVVRFWARGRNVGRCFVGAGFEGAGEHRQPLPVGDYDWREVTCRITTPAGCRELTLQFVADGVTDALWIDDVHLEISAVQLANIRETRYPRNFTDWFPRTPGSVPKHLIVTDISHESSDVNGLLVALQGIVNRRGPRLYLLNPTNPPNYDAMWLRVMREKGYTGREERIPNPLDAIRRFRSEIRGLIVWDPNLPGSVNAAWMLAGLKNALPVSPEMAMHLRLPIVADLRGRWRRNVDAYRYVYTRYWRAMCHHVLAWDHPFDTALMSRDYIVQHRVFLFWVSSYTDREKGADPPAEMEFLEELLRNTPGNIPVMGWPIYAGRGIEEYTAVRLLSEYGKWVPGSGFNSNVSVQSAIHPAMGVFRQRFRAHPPAPARLERDKLYLSVNILDSGDAQWYWQFYQRQIWADPVRGSLPIGYGMNMTLLDTLPLVAQWYYENMTPNDSFFGLLYMNAPVYATRFRKEDRERIWREYVTSMDSYRRRLDMEGIEIYNGGTGGPTASTNVLQRFTHGMRGLRYILADLGRHTDIHPDNANTLLDDTVIFHTLTNFRVWSTGEEVQHRTMESENAWLLGEITANAPSTRPGFMSAMAISWNYNASWLQNLEQKLPPNYRVVSPGDMARLYRESPVR